MEQNQNKVLLYQLLESEKKTDEFLDELILILQQVYPMTVWNIATIIESSSELKFMYTSNPFDKYTETAEKVFNSGEFLIEKNALPKGFKWIAYIPIVRSEQKIGIAICLGRGKNLKEVKTLGDDLGFIFLQYRLKRKLIKDTMLMNGILVASQGMISAMEISPLIKLLIPQLSSYLNTTAIRLYLWHKDEVVYFDSDGSKTTIKFPDKVSIVGTVKAKGRALMLKNASNNPDYCHEIDSIDPNNICWNLIAAPVKVSGKVKSVLLINRNEPEQVFLGSELVWVRSICGEIGANLEKIKLYEDMHAFFLSSIESLASAIEAKDPYTHGHSRRVNLLSMMIGKELNLDKKTMEDMKLSALLHDIGKIAVPEAVLLKSERLTDKEWERLKEHPERGEKMLEPVKEFASFLPGIRNHHEHYDGSGYPDGLVGDNIPLIARIISVADAFDAMTSQRIYRDAMPEDSALDEIEKCKGSQFDPTIAEIFVKIYREYLLAGGENENSNM